MELPSPQVVQYGLPGERKKKHRHVIACFDCPSKNIPFIWRLLRLENFGHKETLRTGKYGSLLAVTCTAH